jgi:hypothetical protein
MNELLTFLEGKILNDLKSHVQHSKDHITLHTFSDLLLQKLQRNNKFVGRDHEELKSRFIFMICRLFDAVDVDSRGTIHFDDFT